MWSRQPCWPDDDNNFGSYWAMHVPLHAIGKCCMLPQPRTESLDFKLHINKGPVGILTVNKN